MASIQNGVQSKYFKNEMSWIIFDKISDLTKFG